LPFCETARSLFTAAVRLAMSTLGILNPHLDPLRESRVAVPELGTARRDSRGQTLARHALHTLNDSTSVLRASDLHSTRSLVHWLRTRRLLLVLDNCEHLVDPCSQVVSTLLLDCPDLSILATSREALNLSGEVVAVTI
jgi:hypothetical protein